jgi:hypothetical protein
MNIQHDMSFNKRMDEYFDFLNRHDASLGNWKNNEIQIINDRLRIKSYEQLKDVDALSHQRQIGILEQDQYLISIRDLVYFPPKKGMSEPSIGTYRRILYRYELSGNLGVSILPIDTNGNLILNLCYRHALRSFSCEAPGTVSKFGESIHETIERCIDFEFGRKVLHMQMLTESFIAERGFFAGKVPMYLVTLSDQVKPISDPSILQHIILTPKEFEVYLLKGSLEYDGRTYHFNDGYTNTAYLLAKLKRLI